MIEFGANEAVTIDALPTKLFSLLSRAQVNLASRSGARIPVELQGEGTQSLAVLLLFGAFLRSQLSDLDPDAAPITALEEPEAHLHPSAIRSLMGIVSDLPGQKLVSTHSGDLLASVPSSAIRRFVHTDDGIEAHRIEPGTLTPEEARKFDSHLRRTRGELLFARCWLLVEGETETTLLAGAAEALTLDIERAGVRCVEFSQTDVGMLAKVANSLGIVWYCVLDNDSGRGKYERRVRDEFGAARRSGSADHAVRQRRADALRRRIRRSLRGTHVPAEGAAHVAKRHTGLLDRGPGRIAQPLQQAGSSGRSGGPDDGRTNPGPGRAVKYPAQGCGARQGVTMLELESLNVNQRQAVDWNDGPMLVLAGPGAGKTRVLTTRVARLIQGTPDKRFRVLALTFTTKAAEEMRGRVAHLLGPNVRRARLTTFHGFAADVLRQHGSYFGLRPDFTILNQDADRHLVLRDAMQEASDAGIPSGATARGVLPLIDRLLRNGQDGREQQDAPLPFAAPGKEWIRPVYTSYIRLLIEGNHLDFGALLVCCLRLFHEAPSYRSRLRRRVPLRMRGRVSGHQQGPGSTPADALP